MTEKLEYAPAGKAFYRVATPRAFAEYLLPEDWDLLSPADKRRAERLEDMAEMHGTHIQNSPFRCG